MEQPCSMKNGISILSQSGPLHSTDSTYRSNSFPPKYLPLWIGKWPMTCKLHFLYILIIYLTCWMFIQFKSVYTGDHHTRLFHHNVWLLYCKVNMLLWQQTNQISRMQNTRYKSIHVKGESTCCTTLKQGLQGLIKG